MEKFIINVNDLSKLYVYTDIGKVKDKFIEQLVITKTIPATVTYCGQVNNIDVNSNYILLLNHNKQHVDIDVENNTAVICANEETFFVPDIVYLAIGMLANDLQKKGYYFIQASVVDYGDNRGFMFMGDPSAGKTSLAYSLMKKYNCSLVSNDNVLVHVKDSSLQAVCGTTKMQMRLGVLKEHFPEILDEIKYENNDPKKSEWDIKLYIDDYLKNNNFNYKQQTNITDIFNISTYKGYHGDIAYLRQRDAIDSLLLIYEHLTKQIRSNRYALVSLGYPLPSFEQQPYDQERYNLANDIRDIVSVYDAKGSIEELSEKVYKIRM